MNFYMHIKGSGAIERRPNVSLYLTGWHSRSCDTVYSFSRLWLIAFDNFVCCYGKTLSYRLVQVNLNSRGHKPNFWSKFCFCAMMPQCCPNMISLFCRSKIRRPIGTVFELLLPVLLLSVLILPKWVTSLLDRHFYYILRNMFSVN